MLLQGSRIQLLCCCTTRRKRQGARLEQGSAHLKRLKPLQFRLGLPLQLLKKLAPVGHPGSCCPDGYCSGLCYARQRAAEAITTSSGPYTDSKTCVSASAWGRESARESVVKVPLLVTRLESSARYYEKQARYVADMRYQTRWHALYWLPSVAVAFKWVLDPTEFRRAVCPAPG